MIGRSDYKIRKILLSLLILSGLTVSLFAQDKQISGVINVYRRVVAIGPGLDNVTLNRVDSIAPGDTVLLIQMKGIKIVTDEVATYGTFVQDTIGKPGGYEFLLVQSVNTVTKRIVFRNNILNTFNIKGNVQLIRVPYYNSVTVTGKLTSRSWDNVEKTGGVLAMIVGRKLKLNADIDVSGKGFRGGKDTIGIGECVYTNLTANNHYSYPRTWRNAGYKGEGLAIHDQFEALLIPLHMKGQGINFTGGGGGNGKYSGGGGGSNRGKGGDGTSEKNFGPGSCPTPYTSTNGGTTVKATIVSNGIYLGGGGGTSTHASGSSGSSGANGGGIVFIISDTISGNRKNIKADGEVAGNAVSDGGAGGGGAGGSVILSLQSFSTGASDSLNISLKGGNGGINPNGFGNGGGGGGGLLWTSTTTIPGKVPVKVNYGVPGPATVSEGNGEIKFSFSPRLNGFLINSIRSAVTGNQIDSICSNVAFGQITGTKPIGGVDPYTYLWQISTTSESMGYTLAPGVSNQPNYTSGVLTQTTWFRRIILDSSIPALADYSKPVKIVVQQAITGNLVGKDTTICYNQNPLSLIPLNAGPANGNGEYAYRWIQNLTNTDWTNSPDASGARNNPDYDPPALTTTTYYRRVVNSGRCVNYSASVTITVLPTITGNITSRPDSVICEGSLFNTLGSSAAGGGNLTYRYQWQDSIVSSVWKPAAGINTGSNYSPDTSAFAIIENRFLRRAVFSGPDDVCRNNSSPIQLTRYHKIKNNFILADQTICSGNVPASLSGSVPVQGKGPGTYTYIWQDSSKLSPWTPRGAVGSGFSPSALTDTSWFRRVVNSSKCTDRSLPIRINVHKPIVNNNISLFSAGLSDTTVCYGAIPHLLKGTVASGGTNIPGDYAFEWIFSIDNVNWNPVTAGGTGIAYQPPALVATTYYKRRVISGTCNVSSNTTIIITVLPLITNNIISASQSAVCYNTAPLPLTGAILSGGSGTYSFFWEQSTNGGSTWAAATGVNDSPSGSYQPPVLSVPVKYKRTVKSGANDCCISISNILNLEINPLPISSIYAGPDTTLFSFDKIFHMVADPLVAPETGKWSVISGTGDFKSISDNRAVVSNLSEGLNTFLWTVTNGLCELKDQVNIDVFKEFIPQGFSPNNDGFNNTFIITGLDLANQIAELKIVNGAGVEVFSTSNRPGHKWTDWDGKNSRGLDLAEGTYYYLLKVTTKGSGQVFKRSGFVVVKRY